MGRKKANPPESFPWELFFSKDEKQIQNAISICSESDGNTGSDVLKRAVTVIGISYNSGDKVTLANRIASKVQEIRHRLNKIEDERERETARLALISHFRTSLNHKFSSDVQVTPMPVLPMLSSEEKKQFGSLSPRQKTEVKKSAVFEIEEDDEEEKEEVFDLNDTNVLKSEAVMYIHEAPSEGGKLKLSVKEFVNSVKNKYENRVSSDSILMNTESIKQELSTLFKKLQTTDTKKPDSTLIKNSIKLLRDMEKSLKYKSKPVKSVIIEDDYNPTTPPLPPPKAFSGVIPRSPPLPQGWAKPMNIPSLNLPVQESGISKEEVLAYIKTRGWKEPSSRTKEGLCDYVLQKISKDDDEQRATISLLNKQVQELTNKMLSLTDMYEQKNRELEEMSQKKKSKKQVFEIEEDVSYIKKQLDKISKKLEDSKSEQIIIQQQKEEKKQMCFRMREWLSQDDYNREEALNDLQCNNGNACNVDTGYCEPSSELDINVDNIRLRGNTSGIVKKLTTKPLTKKEVYEYIDSLLETVDLDNTTVKDVIKNIKNHFEIELPIDRTTLKEYIDKKVKKIMKKRPVFQMEEEEENPIQQPVVSPIKPVVKQKTSVEIEDEELEELINELGDIQEDIAIQTAEVAMTSQKDIKSGKLEEDLEELAKRQENAKRRTEEIELMMNADNISKRMMEEIKERQEELASQLSELSQMKEQDIESNDMMIEIRRIQKEQEQLAEQLKKKALRKKCFQIDDISISSEEQIASSLVCGEGEVCNVDTRECIPVNEAEYIEDMTIGGMMVRVTGKNEIIKAIKDKILSQIKTNVIEEIEHIDDEDEIQTFASVIPAQRPSLQQVIQGIKQITGSKIITSAQNKIRVAEQAAIQRIAMCAGIRM